jgi:hypothetical protein
MRAGAAPEAQSVVIPAATICTAFQPPAGSIFVRSRPPRQQRQSGAVLSPAAVSRSFKPLLIYMVLNPTIWTEKVNAN